MLKPQGEKIRQARHGKGWTQARLAEAIGTRERNIIRWENNQHVPRAEFVYALAEATGRPIEFFLTDDGVEETADTGDDEDSELAAALLDVVKLLRRRDRDMREQVAS